MVVAAFGDQRDGGIKLGVGGDNHRCHAAVLQRAKGAGRELAAQLPADFGATDKAHERNPWIGRETAN